MVDQESLSNCLNPSIKTRYYGPMQHVEVDNFVSRWTSVIQKYHRMKNMYHMRDVARPSIPACYCLQYETNMQCSSLIPKGGGSGNNEHC